MKTRWWCSTCQHENFFSPCTGCGKSKRRRSVGLLAAAALAGVVSAQASADSYYSCTQVKPGQTCDGQKLEAFGYGAADRVVFKFVANRPGSVVKYPNGAVTGQPITVSSYGEAYQVVYAVKRYVDSNPYLGSSHVEVLCGPDVRTSCYGMVTTKTGIKRYAH